MTTQTITENVRTTQFAAEILEGLRARSKYLPAKYFYDETGDRIFQEIMHSPEYYPFACELEIFRKRTAELAAAIMQSANPAEKTMFVNPTEKTKSANPTGQTQPVNPAGQPEPRAPFDLIELGAGDCKKSAHLLRRLVRDKADFTYMPIDISANIINSLETQLPLLIPGLEVRGFNGEYLPMIAEASNISDKRKVILFLGSNIGNMTPAEARVFCRRLRSHLQPGDGVLIGVDLKKCPATILAAYNDKAGVTRRFNLNLLERINRELHADFDLARFRHYPVYDPTTGACKSYLISQADQLVTLWCDGFEQQIRFARHEEIFMEISQKYTVDQLDRLAAEAFFAPVRKFYDEKKGFVDALWCAV